MTFLRYPSVLTLFLLFPGARAQHWQLVTPIKDRSDLVDVKMVGPTTAYEIDRALGFVLRTDDAGDSWERRPMNFLDQPKSLWMWDADHGIIGATSGRYFRTSDGFNSITTAFTSSGNNTCLFFVDELLGFAGTEGGQILRTDDGGASWTLQTSGITASINHLFFTDAQHGFGCAMGGYFLRTSDGGTTWEALMPPDLFLRDLHFFDALYGIGVGSAGQIARTDDGGDTWTDVPSPTDHTMLHLDMQGTVLVACGSNGTMIRSTDQGASWTAQDVGIRDHFATSINALGIGLSGTHGMVYRTTDFGATWQPVQDGTAHSFLNKVSFANNSTGVTVGWETMGGFEGARLRTTDGGRHWTGNGLNLDLLGVHLRADGAGSYGGSEGLNGHTADYFATSSGGTTPNIAIRATWSFSPTTYIVAGGYVNAGFQRTTDGGASWTYTAGGNIYDLYFPSDTVGYACGEGGVLEKTMDGGVTWTSFTSPSSGDLFSVFFLNDTLGWLAGAGIGARTMDGGASWTHLDELPQYTMSVCFTDADTGYAVTSSGYGLRSTDGGDTWEVFVDAPFDAQINDAAWVDGALIAVGRFGDVYRAELGCPLAAQVPTVLQTNNELCVNMSGTAQWYLDGEPLPDDTTACIAPETPGSYTVVVTSTEGCASAPSVPVQIVSTGITAAAGRSELLLYPDPVTDVLHIDLPPDITFAAVDILDAQGRLVRNFPSSAGSRTLLLSDLRPGVYLLRCTAGDRIRIARFVKE